ncbi:type III secretion system export apparatus subunit SctS [Achromobacter marplatensis]|uniref:type III secretion system export apparatus subunit SctS n=1 Tax=Achromobacter marplatensis TaxID=470868 RepID=UPI0039F67727
MNTSDIVAYMTQALYLVLWLSLPPIAAAAIIGTLFSLFQALTQIQEQTLSFAIKMVVVFAVILLSARWVGTELYNYTVSVFNVFHQIR